jgi:hypothetical protein
MRILGIILIVSGILGLIYGGFSYTRRRDTVRLGPMSATIEQRESVPIPPAAGRPAAELERQAEALARP